MSTPVNGLFEYTPSTGAPRLVAAYAGFLWTFDGATVTRLPGGTVPSTDLVTMIQVQDKVYGTGGIGPMFQTDGSTVSPLTVNDANNKPIVDVRDMIYFMGRLWLGVEDYVYFSDPIDAAAPGPTVSLPPVRIRGGAGDDIARLIPYRDSQILVFKDSRTGNGSIHIITNSDNTGPVLTIAPLFQGAPMSIVAPKTICHSANNVYSDVFYFTREGLRSLSFTSLDKLTQPTLPFSSNISNYFGLINYQQLQNAFSVVFNDELLVFVPTGVNTLPDTVLAYKLTPDKLNFYNGWTAITNTPGCSAAMIGFNNAVPSLYVGTNSGTITKAFQIQDSTLYTEISKRIDFGIPNRKKTPFKLYVNYDAGNRGTITVSLIYQDGTEYVVGSDTVVAPLTIPFKIPAKIAAGAVPLPFVIDLHHDVNGVILPDFYDVRVKITSTGFPRLLGFELLAKALPYRFGDENRPDGVDQASGPFVTETLTAGALSQEH